MNWQDQIDNNHKGQTGFFKQMEIESKIARTMHNLTELDEYFKTLKKMRETKNSIEKQRLTKWLNDYLDKSTITK